MAVRLLFIGNDESLKKKLLGVAATCECQIEFVTNAEAAIALLVCQSFDLLFIECGLPSQSSLDLLSLCQRQYPELIITLIAEPATIALAVKAMKRGATDVFTMSVSEEELQEVIKVTASRVARRTLINLGSDNGKMPMVAHSSQMRNQLDQAIAIAPFNTTVLITGESGTGKELVARGIHEHSARSSRPFVALNCAAIPDQLLEDELFGHVKGAFTGAHCAREGRFESANEGTLFLDEIGDMSLPLQAKLLRVLQERAFEKLGSSRTICVNVRIIAATSADLEQRIKDGNFRLDLYYRLNVVNLRLPSLRDRIPDIRLLAEQLLAHFCSSAGLPSKEIDAEVWDVLMSYQWPGNVRQLQNVMERAAALSGAARIIYLSHLPEELRLVASAKATAQLPVVPPLLSPLSLPVEGVSLDAVVTNIERELLLHSLSQAGGNKMQAAKLLRMKRTTFVEKLKRLQVEEPCETTPASPAAEAG